MATNFHPLQARFADRATVPAEELHDTCPARHHRGEAAEDQHAAQDDQHAEDDQCGAEPPGLTSRQHDQPRPEEYQDNAEHQHPQPRYKAGRVFGN
jgi:hypothetical protein